MQHFFLLFVLTSFLLLGCKKDSSKLLNNPVGIQAKFVASQTNLKQGDVVNFTDSTVGFPLTWSWTFEGGVPSTSSEQNPTNIKYNTLGSYSVTLVVTNAYGNDSLVKNSYIKVLRELLVPTVETIEVFETNGLSFKAGGNLVDTGSAPMKEMGICWDTLRNSSINSSYTKMDYVEFGDYIIQVKDLEEDTKYYYRAYAINEDGIGYGSEYTYSTPQIDSCDFWEDKFTDPRDGETYRKIEVAGKTWMGDNLNYDTENSWNYNDLEENGEKYGRLYSIEAAQNACPVGWRLPSDQEWNNLTNSIGDGPAFKMMKKGVWNIAPATNSFCFSALPGGYKSLETGVYSTLNFFGYWWTSSKNSEGLNLSKNIIYDNNSVTTIAYENDIAFSVRCIKD